MYRVGEKVMINVECCNCMRLVHRSDYTSDTNCVAYILHTYINYHAYVQYVPQTPFRNSLHNRETGAD